MNYHCLLYKMHTFDGNRPLEIKASGKSATLKIIRQRISSTKVSLAQEEPSLLPIAVQGCVFTNAAGGLFEPSLLWF